MSNQFNAIKFFETFAMLIAEREKVNISVTVKRPGEIVHHSDCNKRNNDPSNLQVMTQSEHIKLHLREGGGRL